MSSPSSKTRPSPKPIAMRAGYTLPHVELYRATVQFLDDARHAMNLTNEENNRFRTTIGIDPLPPGDWNLVQHYSKAVQVFSALTAEAVLNTYGIVRFERKDFEKYFRRHGSAQDRLKMMVECAGLPPLTGDSEIIMLLDEMMKRRHTFVHYQCDERIQIDGSGEVMEDTLSYQDIEWPSSRFDTAQKAFVDLQRFLHLFRELDPEVRFLFYI